MDKTDFKNHDEYIASKPEQLRSSLEKLRKYIQMAAPQAEEIISYQMPAFRFHGILAYYAAFKNHFSIFVSPIILQTFHDRLTPYNTTKSAIHFPFNKGLPNELITDIVLYALQRNLENKLLKDTAKAQKKNSKLQ